MTKRTPPEKTPKLDELIPEHILKLLGEPPTLPFEDVDDFNALHAELVAQYDPKDMVEYCWIRDLAESRWEIMRYRGMFRAAIESKLPAAAAQLVPQQLFKAVGDETAIPTVAEAEPIAIDIVRKAARGNEDYRRCLASVIRVGGVTTHMLNVLAYAKDLKLISALSGMIAMEQHRFDQIVRNLENRRKTNATMARSFGRKAGDVVDVELGEDDAEEEASS